MVDIKYKNGNSVLDPNDKSKPLSYHVDIKLRAMLDKVKERITKKDKDFVMLCDGYEGAGKSTFMQQVGKYVDPTLNLPRVCMTAKEFKKAILKAKKGNCVIYDEAVTGLSAGESITRVGRLLKSMMMQMRQKNLFVIVILPSVFEFNKYAVLSRAQCLFHVYEINGRIGNFVAYNRKDLRKLYLQGKKTHTYRVRTHFNGRFFGKYSVNEEEYRKKKGEALKLLDDDDSGRTGYDKMTYQRKIFLANLIVVLKHYQKLTYKEVSRVLDTLGMTFNEDNLAQTVVRARKTGNVLTFD